MDNRILITSLLSQKKKRMNWSTKEKYLDSKISDVELLKIFLCVINQKRIFVFHFFQYANYCTLWPHSLQNFLSDNDLTCMFYQSGELMVGWQPFWFLWLFPQSVWFFVCGRIITKNLCNSYAKCHLIFKYCAPPQSTEQATVN